jgi:5-methylcytosine-specific restriction endonuclease McrA
MGTVKYNLKSQIRSALRRVWLYSPMRRDALGASRVSRGVYRCGYCGQLFGPKMMNVDHKVPATAPEGTNDATGWGKFIVGLLYEGARPENLVSCCKDCHKEKTKKETSERRGKKKKRTIKRKKGRKK